MEVEWSRVLTDRGCMWVCISMLAAARRHRQSLMKYFCSQSSNRGYSPSTSLALILLSSFCLFSLSFCNSTHPAASPLSVASLVSSLSLFLPSPLSFCAARPYSSPSFFTSFRFFNQNTICIQSALHLGSWPCSVDSMKLLWLYFNLWFKGQSRCWFQLVNTAFKLGPSLSNYFYFQKSFMTSGSLQTILPRHEFNEVLWKRFIQSRWIPVTSTESSHALTYIQQCSISSSTFIRDSPVPKVKGNTS